MRIRTEENVGVLTGKSLLDFALRIMMPCLLISLTACSSRVHTSSDKQADLSVGRGPTAGVADAGNAGPGEKFDPVEDELISKETLKAWRIAIAHDELMSKPEEWQKVKVQDEEEAMKRLQSLAESHPNVSYIKTMMGQVKQHFGHKEEAAAFYEEAALQNRRDPILIFKAAELRRKAGKFKRAKSYYEQVLKLSPDFPGAKLGIARCLLAEKDTEKDGRKLLAEILAEEPENKEAKEALAESSASEKSQKKK